MKNWVIQLIVGVLAVIAGFIALANPFAASMAVEQIAAWSFIIIGLVQAFACFREEGWGGRIWTLLIAIITFLLGIQLLLNPLAGMVSLTIMVGVMFLISGVFKIIVGLRINMNMLKWMVVIGGVVSLVLAFMVFTNLPKSAAVTLGIMLAVELLSTGASFIGLALSRERGGVSGT